jgi:hypothetical protein
MVSSLKAGWRADNSDGGAKIGRNNHDGLIIDPAYKAG